MAVLLPLEYPQPAIHMLTLVFLTPVVLACHYPLVGAGKGRLLTEQFFP
jgi:hypothetical protein